MITNILDYLERSADNHPDKCAYFDEETRLTYKRLRAVSGSIGTFLVNSLGKRCEPVLIFMDRTPAALCAFFGTVYSGNFYVPIDMEMPEARMRLIADNLKPAAIIAQDEYTDIARKFCDNVFLYDDIVTNERDEELLKETLAQSLDTDPVYVLYTSGSTGVPKGVVVGHRSLIDYIEHFSEEIGLSDDDIIANQAPFYFDASLVDLYCTLRNGGTMGIVPTPYFSVPLQLLDYLDRHDITTIRWVPSAMKMVSMFKGFESIKPGCLRKVIFGAEAMPTKVYNYWKRHYPQAVFVQNYGPTEITGVCTYYIIDREFADEETIPIGRPFRNTEVFLLDEEDNLITEPGTTGEICVRGSCLSLGYYNAQEQSDGVFVNNPLNPRYRNMIYRTGDLAKYNEYGELVFICRKDFQIKHMGHRIELGEIETAVMALPEMKNACCLFDDKKQKIVLFYVSDEYDEVSLTEVLKDRLPRYMLPNTMKKLDVMPLLPNGKTDRVGLKKEI